MSKHDQKTRHVGLAHVAQPSYLALTNFGEVSTRAKIRCCVRAGGLSGLPSSSEWSGGRGATALPVIRGFALIPWVVRPARRAGPTSGRNKLRPSLGFGPVAGRSSPRNRVTKSRTRRCQRSIIRPSEQDVNQYTPFPRRFQAGNAIFGNCVRVCSSDVRGHAPPRWRLSMLTPKLVDDESCAR